eukprot:356703-Chlamydomonas_euryale.AAC.5
MRRGVGEGDGRDRAALASSRHHVPRAPPESAVGREMRAAAVRGEGRGGGGGRMCLSLARVGYTGVGRGNSCSWAAAGGPCAPPPTSPSFHPHSRKNSPLKV